MPKMAFFFFFPLLNWDSIRIFGMSWLVCDFGLSVANETDTNEVIKYYILVYILSKSFRS